MRHSPIATGLLTLASHRELLAQAERCGCGYAVNATVHPQFALFTDYFETDFLHTTDISATSEEASHGVPWRPQAYNTSAKITRGSYATSKQLRNIIPNPLPSGRWGGEPANGGDAGLQLWVRHSLDDDRVPIAEISSPREDILYGSFRAAVKFSGNNGTCGAFFWYRNDTQEIDIEFLSREPQEVNFVVHSPESDKASSIKGSGALGVIDRSESAMPWFSFIRFAEGFHEYRFDWMTDRIDFYVDGLPAWTTTKNIPDSPGHLILSHWSNGGASWTGGPPMEDAVMTVGYVKAYFNTTTSGDEPAAACRELQTNAVCVIPEQEWPPEPRGQKTHFFSMPGEERDPVNTSGLTFPASGSGAKSDHSIAAWFGMKNLVWYFVGGVCSVVYCLAS
jgi:hypothetical protein